MKKINLDLSMISDETLRAIEETLLAELHDLRRRGNDAAHDRLMVELRKLEDHFES
jgi:hypothetical protein